MLAEVGAFTIFALSGLGLITLAAALFKLAE